MAEPLDPADLDVLHTFRHLSAEARVGLEQVRSRTGDLHMERGYVESRNVVETYKPLCIPVRRAYRDSDRASFANVSKLLRAETDEKISDRLIAVTARYDRVRRDLDGHTLLNDRPLGHREIFDAWMDAVIFGSFGGMDAVYRRLLDECGKAVEGVAVRITEEIAECMLELDGIVAQLTVDA